MAPANQGKVVRSPDDPKKGKLPISRTEAEEVERRPFRQVEFLPAYPGWTPPRLDASVILPGFFGSEPTIYASNPFAPHLSAELLTRAPEQKLTVVPTVSRNPDREFFPIAPDPETPADDDAGASINAA